MLAVKFLQGFESKSGAHFVDIAGRKMISVAAGVWVGAQVDPLVVFVGVVSELGWG